MYTSEYIYIYIFLFHILFHYGLSQDIEYIPLCCTVVVYPSDILEFAQNDVSFQWGPEQNKALQRSRLMCRLLFGSYDPVDPVVLGVVVVGKVGSGR